MAAAIMIVAGEASGDLHGAALALALRARDPGCSLIGMGGPAMVAAGVRCVADVSGEARVGFLEAVTHLGALHRAFRQLRSILTRPVPPEVVVLIDFPEFNLRLARVARGAGVPVVYFIPPQLWAWRPGRVKAIRRLVSLVLAVFPFEPALYRRAGVPVEFVGHPLRDRVAGAPSPGAARAALGLDGDGEIVGLLPGSRPGEVGALLGVMREAARRIRLARPRARFVLALAPTVDEGAVRGMLGPAPEIAVVRGQTYDVMRAADLLLIASGTATLEAALLRTPMVVCYRLGAVSELIARTLLRVPWIALPNLVLGRAVVPELYRRDTTPEGLARAALALLGDAEALAAQRAAFAELAEHLGAGDVAPRAAALVLAAAERGR
jgi:lipid-A-disaccharide synthase